MFDIDPLVLAEGYNACIGHYLTASMKAMASCGAGGEISEADSAVFDMLQNHSIGAIRGLDVFEVVVGRASRKDVCDTCGKLLVKPVLNSQAPTGHGWSLNPVPSIEAVRPTLLDRNYSFCCLDCRHQYFAVVQGP
jgi:hypothetical protein